MRWGALAFSLVGAVACAPASSFTHRPAAGLTAGLAHAQSGLYAGDDGARAVLALRVGADLGSSRLLPAPSEWHSPSLFSDFWAGKPIPTTISALPSP